jgi:hypothetical protein
MAVITSQKITTYYERYKAINVTFSQEIIQVTGLITQQVFLKCVSDFWPCVIYSSSFQEAKVVVNTQSGLVDKLRNANNLASLRFSFKNAETGQPVTFFVNVKSTSFAPYGGSQDVGLFTLQFTQRPPDDLIEIMGRMLDANVNSAKRQEERILLTVDSIRKLGLLSKETAVFIQKVPRRCILRDISFSGAKVIMMGVAKFLVDRPAALRFDFDDPRETFLINGDFIRSEAVEGRKELIALAMRFNLPAVPMGYKMRINDYLGSVRVEARGEGAKPQAAPEPAAKSQAAAPPDPAPQAAAPSAPQAAAPQTADGEDFSLPDMDAGNS